ncbi:oligosaccharide flippase family protein [Alloalcanivorax xenomutans]|uniref:lipopolysaccharide biosynthesis protein n=1 Tax=Alloalcanivorax xenomutans TaxID=1094342 RepID=UPI003A80DA0A
MHMLNKFSKKTHVKSILTLVGGTAFSQVVSLIALPIITRIYAPEDFGVLALFSSIVTILAIAGCLRYEIAIPLPKSDDEAFGLMLLSLLISAFFSLFLFFLVFLCTEYFDRILAGNAISKFLFLIPLGVWLTSSYNAIQYWATRKKEFKAIATTRMSQACTAAFLQIVCGLIVSSPVGLLIGQICQNGAGVVNLTRKAVSNFWQRVGNVRWSQMKRISQEYQRFPKYSAAEGLANSAGIQLPLMLIATMAVSSEAGFLLLAMRVLTAPMGLIGGAVAQVYYSNAAEKYREENIKEITLQTLGALLKIGVGPILFLSIVAPNIFPLIFGENWERAGVLVGWMGGWMAIQFISSPVSMSMHIRGWQKGMLVLTIFGLVVRVGSVLLAYCVNSIYMVETYIVSSTVFYAICLFVFVRAAQVQVLDFVRAVFRSGLYIVVWIGVGLIFNRSYGWFSL